MEGAVVLCMMVFILALVLPTIIGMWKIFTKAGHPGWAALVPIYNIIVMLEIARKPIWWIILFLIPFVGIVFAIITWAAIVENFGKSGGFVVGLIFLPFIFIPILGFGDAQYLPNTGYGHGGYGQGGGGYGQGGGGYGQGGQGGFRPGPGPRR